MFIPKQNLKKFASTTSLHTNFSLKLNHHWKQHFICPYPHKHHSIHIILNVSRERKRSKTKWKFWYPHLAFPFCKYPRFLESSLPLFRIRTKITNRHFSKSNFIRKVKLPWLSKSIWIIKKTKTPLMWFILEDPVNGFPLLGCLFSYRFSF